MHRDYSEPGSYVAVAGTDDRIEVRSRGTLPRGVTAESLSGEHKSAMKVIAVITAPALIDRLLRHLREKKADDEDPFSPRDPRRRSSIPAVGRMASEPEAGILCPQGTPGRRETAGNGG